MSKLNILTILNIKLHYINNNRNKNFYDLRAETPLTPLADDLKGD